MSPENTSYLRFSLEENVWFQSGQEVSELYSISLEPNVSVHEVEEYVILRGTLDLTGEYKPQEGNIAPKEDELNRRYVSITDQQEDTYEFQHHFPVDITVPTERVQDRNELSVGVQSFDYYLLEDGCLQLTAELWITGIQEELTEREEIEEEAAAEPILSDAVVESREAETKEEEPPEEIRIEAKIETEEEELPEEIIIEAKAEELPLYRSSIDAEKEEYEEELTPFSFPSYPTLGKESSNEVDFYAEARIPIEQEAQADEDFDEDRDFLNHLPKMNENKGTQASYSAREEHARNDQKKEEPKAELKNTSSNKAESKSLLYDLFTPDEETRQAKLKVYIVQGNETVDSLAERYQINAQHIARVNRIGEIDSLRAGQVIYIPIAASSNKSVE